MLNHARTVRIAPSILPLQFRATQSQQTLSPPTAQWSHHRSSTTLDPHCTDVQLCCSSTLSLRQTKQVHAIALLKGLLPRSVSVCASLVLSYANFGDPTKAGILFECTAHYCRTAFLWNTLIRAQTISNLYDDGLRTYNRMLRVGVRPDDHTLAFVLKVCSDFSEVQKGMEIHGLMFKLGFHSDVFVANTLLLFYGSGCGDSGIAERVFDEMVERDIVSWNTIIGVFSFNGWYLEALDLLWEMKMNSVFKPNEVSVVTMLPVCRELEDVFRISQIHSYVVKLGMDFHVTIRNAMVDAYGKCGNVKESKKVFDEMVERNDVSWNSIIVAFACRGYYREALDMFRLMVHEAKPNSVTISSMLPVLVELRLFTSGRELHAYCLRRGMESDIFISNSLIDMYAKLGHPTEALKVFNEMDTWNVVSWNAMVANFAQNGFELESVRLVRRMQVHGEIPNSITLTNVLPGCARVGLGGPGKEIHARAIRTGITFDLLVSNALMDMYAKCGCLNLARNVFNSSLKDEVSYNILILGYSQANDCHESLALFSEMGLKGMKHDTVSYMGVLSACANISAIKQGKEIHGFLMRRPFHTHLFVANSLLDLYTKCGRIGLARKVFDRIPKRDAASWNTMILGYGMLGELNTAFNLFEAMTGDGVKYDKISYIAVLSVCSHGGLVEKGRKYFREMCDRDIRPTHMHYACMVDLLGRAGLMDEVVDYIRSLPIAPDANVWGALLGASRLHGNIELAAWAAEHLFELKPEHCGYYILLSNMYADAGRWVEADRVRDLMKSRGVKKNPGCSWVQIQDEVHAFAVGERIKALDSCIWLEESA